LENPLYENNAGFPSPAPHKPAVAPTRGDARVVSDTADVPSCSKQRKRRSLVGFYDTAVYVGAKFFAAPSWLLGTALLVRNLVRSTADAWFYRLVDKVIVKDLLTCGNLVTIIHHARGRLFVWSTINIVSGVY
jgi:hypothetical protein